MARGPREVAASVALSYSVYVRGAAERDVAAAQKWYEEQQQGLAAEFNIEFNATVDQLAENPLIYAVRYRDIRRALLHRFPFLVWYRVQGSEVTVLAYTHGKADSSKLRSRLG